MDDRITAVNGWLEIPKCKNKQCLGPLHFQKSGPGSRLSLKAGDRYAERDKQTHKNALAFSNRPIAIKERIHIRVERCDQHWQGALRVGFTARPPALFAHDPTILTADPGVPNAERGYWVCVPPTCHSWPGAELCFWVNSRGVFKYRGPDGVKRELFDGVNVRQPLWALIEVYGQTRAVRLLGSEIKGCWFRRKRKSCPVPPPPPASLGDSCMCVDRGQPCRTPAKSSTYTATQPQNSRGSSECVVCRCAAVSETLACGHRCMCFSCTTRVVAEFGTCPICRTSI
ncbi:E3 ubiquitin-protein ligase NEURL1 [Merluccius polli]|uniref:E3 ubiquitin-protein ligase NEURL1 n=1 Tax=Merluccius polli TaxID=89951 RepID=A0AA47MKX6_MERPO|nr:E3 ubiquitin-protein ligase NEURL1 [Merluccius polli]